MERRRLGRTNLDVTFVGFGALEIGRDWGLGANTRRPPEETACTLLNRVLDLGVNLIDTASAYHKSEERIGKFLASRRHEFVLTSKCGEHSREPKTYYDFSFRAVRESIERSLKLLRTDHIDVMQIHFGPEPEKVLESGETVAAMKEAQAEGKIRFLGASPPTSLIDACLDSGDFDVLQVDYSLLNREAEPQIARAARQGVGILVRGGFGGGYLTPRVKPLLGNLSDPRIRKVTEILNLLDGQAEWLPALALQFLSQNPHVTSVLVGTKSVAHFEENITLLEKPLPPQAAEFLSSIKIAGT